MNFFRGKISRREFLAATGLSALALGCTRFFNLDELNEKITDKSKFPIVVIGAGTGGLTAAAYLTKYGFPVTVVESHYIPGGYATSFERGRFEFEVSLHQTCAKNSASEMVLEETGILDRIELADSPELCRLVAPNHDVTFKSADPEAYIETLAGLFPSERDGIERYVRAIQNVREGIRTIPDELGLMGMIRFPGKYPEIWKLRGKTLDEMLDEYTNNAELRYMLAAFWQYYGLPPSKLTALFHTIAMGGYIVAGGHYYKPRSQALSNATAKLIEERGGQVILNEDVTEIVFDGKRIKGVRTASGQMIPAAAVVSNVNAPTTFTELVPKERVPSSVQKKLTGYKPSLSTFLVWLGLKGDIRELCPAYETFVNEHTYSHEEGYEASLKCDMDKAPFAVNLYDHLYEGYSSPGTSNVGLLVMSGFEPWKRFYKAYMDGDKKEYNAHKEALAKTLIARVEKTVLPGVSSMIEEMTIATPLTNITFTGNPDGAVYGYAQTVDNSMETRNPNRTEIPGLYLAGAWGYPGGGYTGAQLGARAAVKDLLKDLG